MEMCNASKKITLIVNVINRNKKMPIKIDISKIIYYNKYRKQGATKCGTIINLI